MTTIPIKGEINALVHLAVCWQQLNDGKSITGELVEERLQDNCTKDARRIVTLKFSKI